MATHSSVLAWRIPGTGEPGGLPSVGSHGVGHDWSNLAPASQVDSLPPGLPGKPTCSYIFKHKCKFIYRIISKKWTARWNGKKMVWIDIAKNCLSEMLFCWPHNFVCSVTQSCPALWDPMDCSPPGSYAPWDTGVGCHLLLQWIFLIQGLNPHL